ncbi:MAG TPA: ArsA family ATPase [Acidimicrobiia bacterium]|nr:ArsA family ATPase [Acidimicrobiia bacterium]
MTRVLLFTGKGGVGKTTVAAATAARVAAGGARTVVCSTDPAHSLGDAYGLELSDDVQLIAPRLAAVQLDARRRLEETWDAVRDYLVALFDWAGAAPVEAEELAVVPGLDEVFALADIKQFADSGDYDVVVVDCAPTAETLRMLSLPDVLGWYMDRVFPTQRRVTRTVRPLLARVLSMPIASEGVFSAVHDFAQRLDGVRDLLTDADQTSARIVVNAERMVVAEARRMFTYLHLFGYHVDAVIANRLLPAAVSDPWFDEWRAVQAGHLETIDAAFAPVPVLTAELAPGELIGLDRLAGLAVELYGDIDPAARLASVDPLRIESVGDTLVLSMPLPGATRGELELGRHDDELLLAVGSHRRAVSLPDSLARREVGGARFEGDRLEVAFVNGAGGRL